MIPAGTKVPRKGLIEEEGREKERNKLLFGGRDLVMWPWTLLCP